LGRALLRLAIDAAALSPAITLNVTVGNPAEILYRDIGFVEESTYKPQ
jgi:ribosomal protein S18 acetylase RimI-like enzyme